MPQCKNCKLFIKIKIWINASVTILLVAIRRSQTQAVFRKERANSCKGKCYFFRNGWFQAHVKDNPASTFLCLSGLLCPEGAKLARAGFGWLFSTSNFWRTKYSQPSGCWLSWPTLHKGLILQAGSQPGYRAAPGSRVVRSTWSSGNTRRLILSSIDTFCIYNKIAGTG